MEVHKLLETLHIAERLKDGHRVIADRLSEVTVLFADLKGFSGLSTRVPPDQLVSRLDRPVARELIFEKVYDMDASARPEAIESYVSRLRKKLEGTGASITTLRGLGYLLTDAV